MTEHGYQAYLVGGSVRDIIIGQKPKDFDVATDAHPEDVKSLFRNSRMIGRRFRIVHVRFGREIVEVATFRAPQPVDDSSQSDTGMLLSDNIFGSFEDDVIRRDFSINALYFSPESGDVLDLVGGLDDINARVIRLIGNPESRYREDPVRMLRAVRFRAKLDFQINEASSEPIPRLGYLLQDISSARLFEELLKLFLSGYAERAFDDLLRFELFGWLFPDSRRAMDHYPAERLIRAALASTDSRIAIDLPVTPAFVFAALLWYPFVEEKTRLEAEGASHLEANNEAAANVLAKQQLIISIPRRFSSPMREIWELQFRLPARHGRKPEALVAHKRFRAAYDFLLLREQAGEKLDGLGDWWTRYQDSDESQRQAMHQQSKDTTPRRRSRRSRRKRNRGVGQDHAS